MDLISFILRSSFLLTLISYTNACTNWQNLFWNKQVRASFIDENLSSWLRHTTVGHDLLWTMDTIHLYLHYLLKRGLYKRAMTLLIMICRDLWTSSRVSFLYDFFWWSTVNLLHVGRRIGNLWFLNDVFASIVPHIKQFGPF